MYCYYNRLIMKKMKKILVSLTFLLTFLPFQTIYAFRCQGKLVSIKDTKSDVLMKCGEPTFKDQWFKEILTQIDVITGQKKTITIDIWLYNLGARRLTQLLQFENNKLTRIDNKEYGYKNRDPRHCLTMGDKISKGDTKPEILMKCGEPNHKTQYQTEQIIMATIQKNHKYPVILNTQFDEWTYNLGSTYYSRTLLFEEGILIEVNLGERGH
ncbi:conserved hypothetical protein, membrane or secreted [Beggiatoa sp. PS]|nr:conserved hypothetical protein, membrane or secreted [Beggiatoa sp. PS]